MQERLHSLTTTSPLHMIATIYYSVPFGNEDCHTKRVLTRETGEIRTFDVPGSVVTQELLVSCSPATTEGTPSCGRVMILRG